MKPFLQPLSAKEETIYLEKLHSSNKEEAEKAMDQLIQHNMRLVAHIAKKYQSAEKDLEEYISVGSVGLMKAVLSFDQTKGSKLGTYAARCIENELLMMLRSKKKAAREISLQEPVGVDQEGNECRLMDIIESDARDIVEEIYTDEMIQKALFFLKTKLSAREQEILSMRYGLFKEKEYTQKEVGDKLHISRSYVSRIEKKALRKLKTLMDQEE